MKFRYIIIDASDEVSGTNDIDVAEDVEDALVIDAGVGSILHSGTLLAEYVAPEPEVDDEDEDKE